MDFDPSKDYGRRASIRDFANRDAVLEVLLSDTDRAWTLQTDGTYLHTTAPDGVPPLNSQRFLLEWYAAQHES